MDKRVRGGKLYLRKGVVLDVHPGATADVAVDETGDVLRVRGTTGGWGRRGAGIGDEQSVRGFGFVPGQAWCGLRGGWLTASSQRNLLWARTTASAVAV